MDAALLQRDETPVHFQNPLRDSIEVTEFNEVNEQVTHILSPEGVITRPKWLADVLKKHLVDAIINKRNLGFITPEKRMEIYKEIEVEL